MDLGAALGRREAGVPHDAPGPTERPRGRFDAGSERALPAHLRFCIRAFRRHYGGATALTPPSVSVHVSRELALLDLDLSSLDEQRLSGEHPHEFLDGFQARLIGIDEHLHEQIFRLIPSSVG